MISLVESGDIKLETIRRANARVAKLKKKLR
jgi:uncharacterized membrane protein YcaP (DUF421 family)